MLSLKAAESGVFIAKNAASSDNFRIVGGELSHWDGEQRRWVPIVDGPHLSALCCELYTSYGGVVASLSDAVEGRVGSLARGRINAYFARRQLGNHTTPAHLWGFKGGVFNVLYPGELRPAEKDDFVTHFLPYDIEMGAELPRELVSVIFSAVEQSDAMTSLLLDLLAYIMFDNNRFQRFFSWYGIGGAGKGLLTRLLIALLGRNRCYSLDTDALYQGRSDQLVAADGKQLLILQEADRAMPKAKLKALTGEDMIQVRALYGAPFEFVFDGHFLMVSNPPFPESMVDTGILRRIVPIQFSRAAARPDLTLEPRLLRMLGQICGALFDRWQERVKGWTDFPTTGEIKRDLEFYTMQEDSPKAWLVENVKKDADGVLKMSDMMARYEMEKGELSGKDRDRVKKAFQRAIRSDLGVKLKNGREYAASWITEGDTQTSVEHTQESVVPQPIEASNLLESEENTTKPQGVDEMKADLYWRVTDKQPGGERFGAVLWNGEMSKDAVLKVRVGELDKRELPALMPSINKSTGHSTGTAGRADENLIAFHTGWLVFDVDNVEGDINDTKRRIAGQNFVTAVWLSPSGKGLKFLTHLSWKPESVDAHKAVYLDVVRYFECLGIELDKTCANPSRLCFLSYDELPILNFEAEPFRPTVGSRPFDWGFPIDGPWPSGKRHRMLTECAAHYARTTSAKLFEEQVRPRLRATFEWEKRERLDDNPALLKEFNEAVDSALNKFGK